MGVGTAGRGEAGEEWRQVDAGGHRRFGLLGVLSGDIEDRAGEDLAQRQLAYE